MRDWIRITLFRNKVQQREEGLALSSGAHSDVQQLGRGGRASEVRGNHKRVWYHGGRGREFP